MTRRPGKAVLGGLAANAVLVLAACSGNDAAQGPTQLSPTGTRSSSASTGTTPGSAGAPDTSSPRASAGSPTTPATPPPTAPISLTMVMSGDVLLHEGLWATAQHDAERTGRGAMDFRPILANMRSVVTGADLAICHMETPLAPKGGPYSAYPIFSVPPEILPALKWEGYDACTTASNHSIDKGFEGLKRTIADFDRIGLAHFGTATNKAASRRPLVVDVRGVKVGLINATYGTNGIPLPEEASWSVPLIDPDKILRMAHRARLDGARIVIVGLHWGLEYDHEPSSDQTSVAETLMASPDISFVYGHHAHVVQPYDKVNGKWVVYGLGNAIAQQDTAVTGVYDGNTARVTFVERPDGSFGVSTLEYIPTMITPYDDADPTGHPMRWLNVPQDLADPTYAALRPQLLATQARVRQNVNLLGALKRGVTEGR